MSQLPLEGIRVVELARILAGPWAGQVLADLGADVVKIESIEGDDTRQWGPPFVERNDGSRDAAYFHSANRNKRSEFVDFRTVAGQEKVRQMAKEADVLIENFKVGGLKKYRLDYDSLSALNPQLVYCSITGFGQDGPYAERAGYDFIVQGMSGIMDLTGETDGPPQKIGVAYADIMTGLYAVVGIQAALAERERSGLGQQIDVALFDVMVGTLANQAMNFLVSGQPPRRLGNAHPNIVPYAAFPAADAWFILAIGNDRQFEKFCGIIGLELESRFATNDGRVRYRTELTEMISAATRSWNRDALLERLNDASIPAGPINTVAEAFGDPQIRYRGMSFTMSEAAGIEIPGVKIPIAFSRSPIAKPEPSPRQTITAEHTGVK